MRILESSLYAENLDEAAAFYGTVMGLEQITAVPGRHVFFRVGQGVLLLFRPSATVAPPPAQSALPVPPHGALGPGHVCFSASGPEIDAWIDRLNGAGIPIESDFEWPQGGRSIYFRDPADNSIEFAEPRIWGLG